MSVDGSASGNASACIGDRSGIIYAIQEERLIGEKNYWGTPRLAIAACLRHVGMGILTNPRYTGHEVWNKQRKDEVLIDVDDVGLGHEILMRWNDSSQWISSNEPVHDVLVTIEDFDTEQAMFVQIDTKCRPTGCVNNMS